MKKTPKQLRKEALALQKRIRSGNFGILVIGVLSLAGFYLFKAFYHPAPPLLAGNVIDVSASMSGFGQKEWVRLALGGGVVVMGLLILATV